jgi:hypothetical protein
MRQLRDVLFCAFTFALFLGCIVALDALTGVPFSYGVPLSAIVSLLPYAFMVRRAAAPRRTFVRQGVATDSGPRRAPSGRASRASHAPRGSRMPAAIHSVVFFS